MKIGKCIGRMIGKRYIFFPVLWRKDTGISFGDIGAREWIGLQSIAMWYLIDRRMRFKEYFDILLKLKEDLQKQYSIEDKKILFIVEYPITGRLEKIGKALKKKGYAITLLYSSRLVQSTDALERFKECCEAVYAYDSTTQLLYYIIHSRIPLAHFFIGWNDFTTPLLLLQIRGIMPRIVSEKYDIFSGMLGPMIAKKEYCRAEKYIMEYSDGVCCREYAMEYCVEKLGFQLQRKNLVFLDYAEKVSCFEQKERDGQELSLCYVGDIITEEKYSDASFACFLELAAKCEANECHLHVYPSVWDEKRSAEYIEYAKNSQYFHFHHPVEFSELYGEITQYDYGILPNRKTYLNKEIDGPRTRNKTIYASGNKFFDYISAGIPIIAISPVRLTEEIEKRGGILRWTIDDYDFDELRRRKTELREEMLRSRDYWMIDNRISELTDYYEQVLKNE